jgi:hypothetical protein
VLLVVATVKKLYSPGKPKHLDSMIPLDDLKSDCAV